MADNKNDKPNAQGASMNDSGELLKSLFSEKLNALTLDQKGKASPKKDKKTSGIQKPKSQSQVKGAERKKAEPEIATEEKKIVKSYPVSHVKVDKPKKSFLRRNYDFQNLGADRMSSLVRIATLYSTWGPFTKRHVRRYNMPN
jgi:hypothetical protein